MRSRTIIFFILISLHRLHGQESEFRTVVPGSPVVAGESFTVQYVINDLSGENFSLPVFYGFRLVSGPDTYTGSFPGINKTQPVKNFMVTLVALKPGKFRIPGAVISIRGKNYRSHDNFIEVITREEAHRKNDHTSQESSDYFLRPGEDIQQKLRNNLFVRVNVDKRTCFVGQPVTATFKLYSRLESRSDIVKNPGFYGFTVHDMINLADHMVNTENINGRNFDVHTIRTVQLYPLQEGRFVIDPMEVKNRVEFSRSVLNRRTEQEITEGVLHDEGRKMATPGTETAENEINTTPVEIVVKPLPEKNKPRAFAGAVGSFRIDMRVNKHDLLRNEQGILEIAVSGKGNFTQLSALQLNWPAGVEAFDPVVIDSLNSRHSPIEGTRVFRYPFISSTADSFVIPPVQFSYFNPDTGTYATLETTSQKIFIHETTGKKKSTGGIKPAHENEGRINLLIVAAIGVTAIIGLLLFRRYRSQNRIVIAQAAETPVGDQLDQLLSTVRPGVPPGEFYVSLHHAMWSFFTIKFQLTGSSISKEKLRKLLNNISNTASDQLMNILEECEAGMFTDAKLAPDQHAILADVHDLLKKLT